MTHKEAKAQFVSEIFDPIVTFHENGTPDYALRERAWKAWVKELHMEKEITDWQAENWVTPSFLFENNN